MKSSPGKNNIRMGGASPHNEYISCVITRAGGDAKTAKAMSSKTRSPHKGTDKHYQYEDAGEGWGGNVNR